MYAHKSHVALTGHIWLIFNILGYGTTLSPSFFNPYYPRSRCPGHTAIFHRYTVPDNSFRTYFCGEKMCIQDIFVELG